ncbi:deoxyribonuclease V [Aeoliella mucimassa]|uniref:Endonuclease V n=1 Tax=Aeoliella mucimassa TaxID=2527972 RepID=A0A518AIP4_9BACT|nr:deoxyribonuclease V [Aeoliella mucimassa]QDU54587.1 Endonuclease V [Aeoliella mucimassa]
MKPNLEHPWDLTPQQARALQNKLRKRVVLRPASRLPKLVAGVDVSVSRGPWREATSRAAVVVFDYETLEPLEVATAEMPSPFPYVPGLLSFREVPVLLLAFAKLVHKPDLVLVDGQGYAHPRRLGLASHLGIVLNLATIGCAKTRFIGTHDEPADPAGGYTDLVDLSVSPSEIIGAVVRTRDRVKPLYISAGHRMDTPTAIDHVLHCCDGYRLPEPTRRAHQCAAGKTLDELQRDWKRQSKRT